MIEIVLFTRYVCITYSFTLTRIVPTRNILYIDTVKFECVITVHTDRKYNGGGLPAVIASFHERGRLCMSRARWTTSLCACSNTREVHVCT
jgi:hypothetical protein